MEIWTLFKKEINSLPIKRSKNWHSWEWYVDTATSLHETLQKATAEHFGHQTGASFSQSSSLKHWSHYKYLENSLVKTPKKYLTFWNNASSAYHNCQPVDMLRMEHPLGVRHQFWWARWRLQSDPDEGTNKQW